MGRRKKEAASENASIDSVAEDEDNPLDYVEEERKDKLYSKETIILFNELEDVAYIETQSREWFEHFEKVLKVKPCKKENHIRNYIIPKAWVQLPFRPEEQRRIL